MTDALQLAWTAPGPVAERFYIGSEKVSGIMGPIGSGKSSACIARPLKFAMRQRQSTLDGIRKFKLCIIHQTYRQLWRGTIRTWWHWIPQDLGEWVGAKDGPATHAFPIMLSDGTRCEFIAEFVAIGDNNVEDTLRGYEPTMFWLNEADLLPEEVFVYARGRAGRYPDFKSEGGASWYGVQADFNAPNPNKWVYKRFIKKRHPDFGFYEQPSALSPQAENIQNLVPGYYAEQCKDAEEWYIKRMIENVIGYSRAGKAVFGEYADATHCARLDMDPIPGLDILVGFDAGGQPAGVFLQRMNNGQWRGLAELATPPQKTCGPHKFAEQVNRLISERFKGFNIRAWADPTSLYSPYGKESGEESWCQIVEEKTGLRIEPAPTNDLIPRHDAVRLCLERNIDGRYPGLILSPRMEVTREGFIHGYRYKKIDDKDGEDRYDPEPKKNEYSHPQDALQAVLLGGGEYDTVMARKDKRDERHAQSRAIDEDNPYGRFEETALTKSGRFRQTQRPRHARG